MILLTADVGISATTMLIEKTKETVKQEKISDPLELKKILKNHLVDLLKKIEHPLTITDSRPFVIMIVGVNGAGKTTTIGKIANKIQPSSRGEFEISSVNQYYLDNKDLKIEILGRGFTWLDTGTHDSLLEASNFIKTVEKHTGYKVACPEEIAFKMKFINLKKLKELTKPFGGSSYGKYLKSLVNENQ